MLVEELINDIMDKNRDGTDEVLNSSAGPQQESVHYEMVKLPGVWGLEGNTATKQDGTDEVLFCSAKPQQDLLHNETVTSVHLSGVLAPLANKATKQDGIDEVLYYSAGSRPEPTRNVTVTSVNFPGVLAPEANKATKQDDTDEIPHCSTEPQQEPTHNVTVTSVNFPGVLASEANKAIKRDGTDEVPHCSAEPRQVTPNNAEPNPVQVIIHEPKKPAHYKMFSGPKGMYLFSEPWVPVQVAVHNSRPGLELSASLRYDLLYKDEAVLICDGHFKDPPAKSKCINLQTPNKTAFVLKASGSRDPTYDWEGPHPTTRMPLTDAGIDLMNLVFTCFSSCAPHKDHGSLMHLHLNICDINTKATVSSSVITVRVARNVLVRASQNYNKDMLGVTTPRQSAKRQLMVQTEERDGTANVLGARAKHPKLGQGAGRNDVADAVHVIIGYPDNGNEREDNTAEVVGVIEDPEGDQGGEGSDHDDDEDVIAMAEFFTNSDHKTKQAMDCMWAASLTGAPSSSFATGKDDDVMGDDIIDDDVMGDDIIDDDVMGEATSSEASDINQFSSFKPSQYGNKSIVNSGSFGNILTSPKGTEIFPVVPNGNNFAVLKGNQTPAGQIGNNSGRVQGNLTSTVQPETNLASTVINQNQVLPEERSFNQSTSLSSSSHPDNPPQHYVVSDSIGFVVAGLKNPETDCLKIKRYIESLGASCTQQMVVVSPVTN